MSAPSREPESQEPESGGERRRALGLLGLLGAAFLTFCWHYVPRLNNNVMSDREFTGWTGPIAERIAQGDRAYIDFVLPIPPGSFSLLAAVQKVAGRALLLQELWVAVLLQLAMALLAYAIAASLTSRRIGVLVAACTLVTLLQLPKECIYDHTAQIVAWTSIALGVWALKSQPGRARRLLFAATGFTAVVTLGFKQSTATGIVFGWILAVGYLALVDWKTRGRSAAVERLREARPWLYGAAAGLAVVWLLIIGAGGNVPAFVQAVFLDAPDLKGGSGTLFLTLWTHVFKRAAFSGSLLMTAVVLTVGARVAKRRGEVTALTEGDQGSLSRGQAAAIGAAILVCFLGAVALLALEVRELPRWVWASMQRLGEVPGVGLVFVAVYFVGHLYASRGAAEGDVEPEKLEAMHVFNAVVLVALSSSLLHDASFEQFGSFYNNNPIIAVAFIGLFVATYQSGLRWLTVVAVALALAPIAGRKLNRALSCDVEVGAEGHWAGMRVNYRGVEILKAAKRVRELAGPDETVLVLPEDVQLVGLIDRPRPALRGAIVFVDQYASRLVADDLRAIDAAPPKVIVIHPRKERDWRRLFATWNEDSGSAEVLAHVTRGLLPKRYRLESSFPTVHFWDQGALDIYVRVDKP